MLNNKTMIGLTFDIDWAPDQVIDDLLNLLTKYNAKATLFATHLTPVLEGLDAEQFEIGIHPNFNHLLNGQGKGTNFKGIIDEIKNWFPQSKGARSHSLVHSSPMLSYLKTIGIEYESNLYTYYQHLPAFSYVEDLIRIPYFFADDVHAMSKKDFSIQALELSHSIPNVFDFHPIHIYLNTPTIEHYEKAKSYYQQPSELLKHRNTQVAGARDLLIDVLEHSVTHKIPTVLLEDIAHTVIQKTI